MEDDSVSLGNGLFIDELCKLRVLNPEIATRTQQLNGECKEFVDKINEFQRIVGGFISMVSDLATQVENEKMKAIGCRNLLKSIAKERETKRQQLLALITEKKMQLERLNTQYESLLKVEADQNEFIEQFIMQK
ncbi:Intraflagellar transport protein 20-like protein [Trichoplax sp. H2]|uniref:Intraflagellar transport protein 20 homolog n=1 Tax=Trichoplax adhaerens TaxID=10228 RepID=B3RYV5_TRIAD|nr:hypothetical protein TRIADDRAFT_57229 [Trichoplax adhaerens]EDV23735.1 hypothetical protein TRIADDRAFT_57229 [Trichoplax adhaerens]RDD44359.1 Intraflagellar transport protein 20-like protein [Trichoplax sp. H2]|eukprot:XP_002113261.1 hypothetical protein TRIADDRAFT_57229 [Trichoplax adhaerens]